MVNANNVFTLCFVGSVSLIESIISKILVTSNAAREIIINTLAPGQCHTLNTKAIKVKHIEAPTEIPIDFSIAVVNGLSPMNK